MSEMFRKLPEFLFMIFAASALADSDFKFFDSGIDYWTPHKKKVEAEAPKIAKEEKKESLEVNPSFDWKKHLDPKNTEFFREGDYIPPEPFMELVRNPTDENIKNWFLLIDKKNELADRMQKRIAEYIARNQGPPEPRMILKERTADIRHTRPDAKQFRFRFYFDSTCPHCHKMFQTISELERLGYFIEAFQVDSRKVPLPGLPVPVTKATPDDLKKHKVEAVPLLLIGDLKKKVVYRLSGFQSVESIMSAISGHANES